MKKLIVLAMAAMSAVGAFAARSAFTYQGVIKEVGGAVPADKNRTVEFRIYDGPSSASPLWGRAYNVLLDANGLFNTAITDAAGSEIDGVNGAGLAAILAGNSGTTLYIGVTVDGSSGEISPRQAILAVPYAMHAADAAAASGDFVVEGRTTVKGDLEVSGGTVALPAVEAASLVVSGDVTVETSGSFVGYGTIPVGGIIMWSGSAGAVPDGWALCNGSNGTPNLQGRFVVGYDPSDSDYSSVGKTGGEKTHRLSVNEMPSHTHDYEYHAYDLAASWKDSSNFYAVNKGNNIKSATTKSSGGGQAHENRPPYYALCFIMRVK